MSDNEIDELITLIRTVNTEFDPERDSSHSQTVTQNTEDSSSNHSNKPVSEQDNKKPENESYYTSSTQSSTVHKTSKKQNRAVESRLKKFDNSYSISSDVNVSYKRFVSGLNSIINRTNQHFATVEYWYVAIVIACGCFIYYYGLGSFGLRNFDEAMYATQVTHIFEGYWLVPHHYWVINTNTIELTPFLFKPPLATWLQAISITIFGYNEFAVRFPNATATIFSGVVIYMMGRDMQSRRAGFSASIIFYSMDYSFSGINAGREGGIEMILLLFGLGFVYCVWKAIDCHDTRILILGGVCAGLAVMTKGFQAGIFVIILSPFIYFLPRLRSRDLAISVITTVVIAAP